MASVLSLLREHGQYSPPPLVIFTSVRGIMLRPSSLPRPWHSIDLLNTGNLSPSGSQVLLYLCFLFIKLSYSENIARYSIDPVDNSVPTSWAKNQNSGG
jgi:hypothetical protein